MKQRKAEDLEFTDLLTAILKSPVKQLKRTKHQMAMENLATGTIKQGKAKTEYQFCLK